VNFSNSSTAATVYSWDFGDGSALNTATSPSHIFQNTTLFIQNYTVTLIAENANGCTDTITSVIQAYPEALFAFTMVPDSGCTPLSVSYPSVAGAVLYEWDFGDGTNSTGANPTHIYNSNSTNDTSYIVQLIATNAFNCVDTTFDTLVVFGKPVADFLENLSQGCPALNVLFNNTSTGNTSSSWDFGDGSALSTTTSPSHLYTNTSLSASVVYPVQLIVSNNRGCSDTISRSITVHPDVSAAFTADTPICAPVSVVFTNNSQGSNSYSWNFGDGNSSSLAAPSHTYTNTTSAPIVYQVTLISTNLTTGCDDTSSVSYTIYPTPNASFTANPSSQVYPSATVNFVNTTSSIANWTYAWNFGDAGSSVLTQPGSHLYGAPGTYTVSLIASSAFCGDTTTSTVTIVPPIPVAAFEGSFTGCRPLTVTFTNTSQPTAYITSYNWNFGDGGSSTSTSPTYTFYNTGTYTVTLTATGPGGTSTIVGVDSVTVYELPTAYFVATPTTVYVPNTEMVVTNLSTNASTFVWDFGDGTQSFLQAPPHTYTDVGTYQVSLIAISQFGCVDTFLLPTLITAEIESSITVPNAFSPNPNGPSEDGVYDSNSTTNDIFHPVITGLKKYELRIYNRWGELLFQTEDIEKGWDGYYKGKLCTQDIYIWKIVAETTDDKKLKKAGDVLLLR
jgi:gliding motility-associated-like protein